MPSGIRGRRPRVLPLDEPILAAYQVNGKLGLFIPTLGRVTLPGEYLDAITDPGFLRQLRDQVVAAKKQQGKPASAISESVPGDDSDMQMRRAFLAFQAAGITSELNEKGPPSLTFTWNDVAYVYGADGQVHAAPTK